MTAVGSYSEYGRLREVIVGSAQDLALPPFGKDLSHYSHELRSALAARGRQSLPVKDHFPERWEKTCEQIEGVVNIYEANGVRVHRLRSYTQPEKRYLDWLQPGHSQLYPADPVFVLGNHFMEINIRRAYRRKEVFPIRDIVSPMLARAPQSHYVAMPPAQPCLPAGQGAGPFLEGGDILLHGKNVLVGMGSLCSNQAGVNWLTRYIEPHGYTVHPMPIQGEILHALGIICLLREGLAMAYLPALAKGLPTPLKEWEVIELTHAEMQAHASVGVSLDDKRYLIDPQHKRVMDELAKHGIEPLPAPCDAIGYWGGAIRCITLPLKRDLT